MAFDICPTTNNQKKNLMFLTILAEFTMLQMY